MKLLCLHGFMGSPEDWAPCLEALAEPAFTPPLPGHGGGPVGDSLPTDAARFLSDWLDPCDAKPLLAGYSLGGRFALEMAIAEPQAFSGLVLLGASPGIADEERRIERRVLDRERALRLREDPTAFLKAWYRMPLFGDLAASPGFGNLLRRRLEHDPEELAHALEIYSPGRVPCRTSALAGLPLPVLYLYGSQDPVYSALAPGLRRASPDMRVQVLEGAGHALLEQQPLALAGQLRNFINNLERRQAAINAQRRA